jgi:flagellin
VDGVDFGDGSTSVKIDDATYAGGEFDIEADTIYDQVKITHNDVSKTAKALADYDTATATMSFDFMDGNGAFEMEITRADFLAGKTENINVQSQYTFILKDDEDNAVNADDKVIKKANDLASDADVRNIDLGGGVYVALSLDYVQDSSTVSTVDLGAGIEISYVKETIDGLADIDKKAITFAVTKLASDYDVTLKNNNEDVIQTVNILAGQEAIFDNGIAVETDESLVDEDIVMVKIGNDLVDKSIDLQIGANQGQSMSMDISNMGAAAIKISGGEGQAGQTVLSKAGSAAAYTKTKDVTNGTTSQGAEYALDVSTYENASGAIDVINDAIQTVSAERSKLGAFQNRLEHTINNLGTSSENLTAAESRIRDVDMANEMMEFTKDSILNQAAQAMLAQANQQPQGVLQLLR